MLIISMLAYILFWLLKLIACQFPGVKWLLWLSNNSCGTTSAFTGTNEFFHSAVQRVCEVPWISTVLQYYGIKCYTKGLNLNLYSPTVQSTLSPRPGPVQVVLSSTYDLQRIQEPAMDFDTLTDHLRELRLAVWTAGSKIMQTSQDDRIAIAEKHYQFSRDIYSHRETLRSFYIAITVFIDLTSTRLLIIGQRIQEARKKADLPWYDFWNRREADLKLGRDLDRFFSLTIDHLVRVISRGETAQEILRRDDNTWEDLENWRLAHVKEIQDRIFDTEKYLVR